MKIAPGVRRICGNRPLRVGHRQLQVLGGDAVGHFDGLLPCRARVDQCTAAIDGGVG